VLFINRYYGIILGQNVMKKAISKIHLKFALFNCAVILLIITLLFYAVNAPSKSITIQVSDFDIKNYKGFSFSDGKSHSLEDSIMELVLGKGDTLSSLLHQIGVAKTEAYDVTKAISKKFDLKKLMLGQKIIINFAPIAEEQKTNKDVLIKLLSVNIKISNDKELFIQKAENGIFDVSFNNILLNKKLARVSNTIDKSFFEAIVKSDLSSQAVKEITNAFSYDLDFQRDIQKGNKIDLLYEKFYDTNGNFTHTGHVMYACLTLNNNKKYELFRFTKQNGTDIYLSANGRDTKKDLLKTPINAARISSKFGMRMHPIHGYSKMHKGIDFAARIGTPIFAAGTGIIQEIGYKSGYGRYIKVEHNKEYATAYGHISKFAKGLKKGDKVKQGEVIAYVGNTGVSTAAHLHFEVLLRGKQINPMKVKSTPGEKLSISEMSKFKQYKEDVANVMKSVKSHTEVALDSTQHTKNIH
jgi:murein DD-endopeptidase MepM/ murein hydrolase activator NlpD